MDWEQRSKTYDNVSWVNDEQLLFNFLKPIFEYKKNIKILDAASGSGACCKFLLAKGYSNITCLDLSIDMMNKNNENVTKIIGNIENLDIEDESYDIVIARNVMHYINLEVTMKELNRVTKKLLCISQIIPPCDSLSQEYDKLIDRNIHYPTKTELKNVLSKHFVHVEDNICIHTLNINEWLKNTLEQDKIEKNLEKYKNISPNYKKEANIQYQKNDILVDIKHYYLWATTVTQIFKVP
jgi:ubiquinone/menaquinone biosynthesis C-methylase UbiE